ncbi:MAG: aminopeptidase [Bacteroidetes bacterium]|nr:aminopeptidase [Bacteroidota bacterium]
MKTILKTAVLWLIATSALSQQQSWSQLSKKIVDNVGVQPGECVVISSGQHTIELAEAIAIESNLRGGFTTIFYNTDKITRSLYTDVAKEFLSITPTYFGEWIKHMDIYISLPNVENWRVVSQDVPEERMVLMNTARQKLFDGYNNSKVRGFSVAYPTPQAAAENSLDFAVYEKIIWNGMKADYKKIAAQGEALKKILMDSKIVKVTSPAGTNISFSVSGRKVLVRDGITTKEDATQKLISMRWATIPDGRVTVTAIENSANGQVVVPRDICRFEPLTNIKFDVKSGRMQGIKADVGMSCFDKDFKANTGDKDVFAGFFIGLNPALTPMEDGADYRPENGAGVVHLQFGDNQLQGGKNISSFNWSFPIMNATVEIDGKVVVKDGKIVW